MGDQTGMNITMNNALNNTGISDGHGIQHQPPLLNGTAGSSGSSNGTSDGSADVSYAAAAGGDGYGSEIVDGVQLVAFVRSESAGWFYTWDPNITAADLTTFNVNR